MTRAEAFNEWMRRYTEGPEEYEREFQTVLQFLREEGEGVEPTYGAVCDAYLAELESLRRDDVRNSR